MFKDYFSFSRRERNGIAVLSSIIVILLILPFLYQYIIPEAPAADFSQFKQQIAQLETVSEAKDSVVIYKKNTPVIQKPLFNFDPNIATIEEFVQLGISEKTANTIINYLSKGGQFRKPGDFARVYGLSPALFDKLRPYIQIQAAQDKKNDTKITAKPNNILKVELNSADSAQLETLPGIGAVLASRIVKFRNRLGGYATKEQLHEVYGLSDETYQIINTLITVNQQQTLKISVNLEDVKTMGKHPYIGFAKAKILLQYKKQHGVYNTINDLQATGAFTDEELHKVQPYMRFGE